MFKNILVCLDGSSIAEQILPYATEEALRFNSKVILLQIIAIPATVAGPAEPGLMAGLLEQAKREETQARTYLERIAAPLRQKGLEVQTVTLQGPPGETIVDFARKNNVGLITMATHGRSGLKRLVFGSVADHLLRSSGLPMLVIRPKETPPA